MIRVTVNGESVQFSSKLDIEPQLWDATNQKMIGTTKPHASSTRCSTKYGRACATAIGEIEKYEAYVTAEKVHKAVIDAMNEGQGAGALRLDLHAPERASMRRNEPSQCIISIRRGVPPTSRSTTDAPCARATRSPSCSPETRSM